MGTGGGCVGRDAMLDFPLSVVLTTLRSCVLRPWQAKRRREAAEAAVAASVAAKLRRETRERKWAATIIKRWWRRWLLRVQARGWRAQQWRRRRAACRIQRMFRAWSRARRLTLERQARLGVMQPPAIPGQRRRRMLIVRHDKW